MEGRLTRCPVCGGTAVGGLFTARDDRYGYPDDVRIAVCRDCDHKFVDPPQTEQQVGTLYTRYYQREALDPRRFRPYEPPGRLRGWLDGDASSAATHVPRNVRVLDIGCGMGANVAFHASRGCDAHGVDADANVQAVARSQGLNIRVGLFASSDYADDWFDYVTMDQVFEHVGDPLATLSDIRKVLKQGGRLAISTPNANGWGARLFGKKWINWHAPYHQQFFSRTSVGILARRAGFEVEALATVTRSAWLTYQIAHLLAYPAPGSASIFWAPKKSRLRIHQAVFLKLVMATRLTLLPQLLTRLFDALELGDNFVIVLRKAGRGEAPRPERAA